LHPGINQQQLWWHKHNDSEFQLDNAIKVKVKSTHELMRNEEMQDVADSSLK